MTTTQTNEQIRADVRKQYGNAGQSALEAADGREFRNGLAFYVAVSATSVCLDLFIGGGSGTLLRLDWSFVPVIGGGLLVLLHAILVLMFPPRVVSPSEDREVALLRDMEFANKDLLEQGKTLSQMPIDPSGRTSRPRP